MIWDPQDRLLLRNGPKVSVEVALCFWSGLDCTWYKTKFHEASRVSSCCGSERMIGQQVLGDVGFQAQPEGRDCTGNDGHSDEVSGARNKPQKGP